MNRIPAILSAAALFAAGAIAQTPCLNATGTSVYAQLVDTSGTFGVEDEGETPEIPLGFTFPFADASITCDHIAINANCEIYLTDGTGVVNRALYGVTEIAEARGGVGGSPRIAALIGDAEGNQPTADILLDTSVPNQVKVTWVDWGNYASTTDSFSVSITIDSTGNIQFDYETGYNAAALDWACISAGNDIGTGTESSVDFSVDTTGVITQGLVFQDCAVTPNNNDYRSILFLPNANGFDWFTICNNAPPPPATHNSFPGGCYPISEYASAYQEFANKTDAKLALEGNSLLMAPNGNGGYTTALIPGGAAGWFTHVTPTSLAMGDDAEATVTPSAPFNFRGTTPVADVVVTSNGWINMGLNNGTFEFTTSGGVWTSPPDAAIIGYGEDLDTNNGVDGDHLWEEVGGMLYITFQDVQHYPGGGVAEGFVSMQFQLELASGTVQILYQAIDVGNELATDNVIIGETVTAAVLDPGATDYSATTSDTFAVETVADGVLLSADVPPVSTASTGTVVTYTTSGAPDFSPTFLPGLKVGVIIASFAAPVIPGVDLFFLGAPGCPAHVATLDAVEALGPAGEFVLPYPAGIPPQTSLTLQTAFLFDINDPAYPTSLAGLNGNTFVMTSSPLEAFISNN